MASKPQALRPSITPGTVLILLAGKHKGKRVIFIQDCKNGRLLVTGPYKLNGVPLKIVHQSYVIATKTKLDISKLSLPKNILESVENARAQTNETRDKDQVLHLQKSVDLLLLPLVKSEALLSSYLRSKFSIRRGQAPHSMIF
jgi:large subunit ribosomal protein L6e